MQRAAPLSRVFDIGAACGHPEFRVCTGSEQSVRSYTRRIQPGNQAYVRATALCALQELLLKATASIEPSAVEAQHLCSSSGGADVHWEEIPTRPRRAIFSAGEAAADVTGGLAADRPSAAAFASWVLYDEVSYPSSSANARCSPRHRSRVPRTGGLPTGKVSEQNQNTGGGGDGGKPASHPSWTGVWESRPAKRSSYGGPALLIGRASSRSSLTSVEEISAAEPRPALLLIADGFHGVDGSSSSSRQDESQR